MPNHPLHPGCHVLLRTQTGDMGTAVIGRTGPARLVAPTFVLPSIVVVLEDRISGRDPDGTALHQTWEWPAKALVHLDDCRNT